MPSGPRDGLGDPAPEGAHRPRLRHSPYGTFHTAFADAKAYIPPAAARPPKDGAGWLYSFSRPRRPLFRYFPKSSLRWPGHLAAQAGESWIVPPQRVHLLPCTHFREHFLMLISMRGGRPPAESLL